MQNVDVYALAMLVLDQEEVDECFLRAFHKLGKDEKELVQEAGYEALERGKLHNGESALELVAKVGIQQVLGNMPIIHRGAL